MASKRRIRRNMCQGKVRHASEGAAWAAVRKTACAGPTLHPYLCPHCRRYHVGHRRLDRVVKTRRGTSGRE